MKPKSRFGLSKSQRLKKPALIKNVFSSPLVQKKYPLLVQYTVFKEETSHLIMPVVSKKKFKKAVDRNRIKRQLRNAWRLNSHIIENMPTKFGLAVVFIGKEKMNYQSIEFALINILNQLTNEH